MKRIGLIGAVLAAVVFSTAALAFDAYFSDASGKKIWSVQEGDNIYIAVYDKEKGDCGIAEFPASFIIFDFKTGAYIQADNAVFRELGGIGKGLFFWVAGRGSNTKVTIQVGGRAGYDDVAHQYHTLGRVSPSTIWNWAGSGSATLGWLAGNWEYVATDDLFSRAVARAPIEEAEEGRVENNDTLILILRDETSGENIDQDQIKIKDTVAKITVTPAQLNYGCGAACGDIIVRIVDPDENLNCNEVDYVPFFVIINPGSWNPTQTAPVTNFCSLMMYGGYDKNGDLINGGERILWYNIYDDRYMNYTEAPWWPATDYPVVRAVFFAQETDVSSGIFELNFGNLQDFQAALWQGIEFEPPFDPRKVSFDQGTTIVFYYIDPNDFDDMDLAVATIGNRPHSRVEITDDIGKPISEVKLGWGGLYIRVYDADANKNSCCQDRVVVHICDPHNEDDSEYIVIDEISNNSGIFFTQSGIPLLPVWDAVNGYQLVWDDWKIQAFNEDTIFVRYNSVTYVDLNDLGDSSDTNFPPLIDTEVRNQYWDVSFAKVKVYDFQVFNAEQKVHNMRFLDGNYQPVTEIPVSGSLYLEVTDLDQNENPLLREMIFGGWNKGVDSAPILSNNNADNNILGAFLQLQGTSISGITATVKIFIFDAQNGRWERIDLHETRPSSGVFRSTTCVSLGRDGLDAAGGDTIMAFYQDPSNHSDVSIISIKVSLGGEAGTTPPAVTVTVVFDKPQYNPGDTVRITVTDPSLAGFGTVSGTNLLVLKDKDNEVLTSWSELTFDDLGRATVSYQLPETVKLGKITAEYTNPITPTLKGYGESTVVAKALTNVAGITVSPNPFKTSTTFTIQAEPAGAVAARITITIYDLTGAKVDQFYGTNTASVTWNGGNLRNGAYIYVAVVEGAGRAWTFKGFVYIER